MKAPILTAILCLCAVAAWADDYDTDRGFKHPGGLHTLADFDRVKQQIADGHEDVTAAYAALKASQWLTYSSTPSDTVYRGTVYDAAGEKISENYINAARGAHSAYQNALMWRLSGTTAYARAAVTTLNSWAAKLKCVTGDSNFALGSGLYGYEFAQAAELLCDYDGWDEADRQAYKQWMLDVWYVPCIRFMRLRNGTWANTAYTWQAPGHYWSNWGLCNALALMSIGVLCDDVYIYNQGVSYFKYDQVGTYEDPRTASPIYNDGLNEFLGNLVVTTAEYDGAYGRIGQMQESGRDYGHASMACGLAVELAHMAWNQGDDLFAYMDHRLAAGIEFVAGQMTGVEGMPWTPYYYYNRSHSSSSEAGLQDTYDIGASDRQYWGTILGIFEGVKGVSMPQSHAAYNQMVAYNYETYGAIDGGGTSAVSGPWDLLGWSILMNTRDGLAQSAPTELTAYMTIDGVTEQRSELGATYNTYEDLGPNGTEAGQTVTLTAQLPDGEQDTGQWAWSTGETTQSITVSTEVSRAYRVTYTNAAGLESEQLFTIAVNGDCRELSTTPYYTYEGDTQQATEALVLLGKGITLGIESAGEWDSWQWPDGTNAQTMTLSAVTQDTIITGVVTNHGGRQTAHTFTITTRGLIPVITVDGTSHSDVSSLIVDEGQTVILGVTLATAVKGGSYLWSDGGTAVVMQLGEVTESVVRTLTYTGRDGNVYTQTYEIIVRPKTDDTLLAVGNYTIRDRATGWLLTNSGKGSTATFEPEDEANAEGQQWYVYRDEDAGVAEYELRSLIDGSSMRATSAAMANKLYSQPFRITFAAGCNYAAIYTSSGGYLAALADGSIDLEAATTLTDYPFLICPVGEEEWLTDGIEATAAARPVGIYDLSGRQTARATKGIYIINGNKVVVK